MSSFVEPNAFLPIIVNYDLPPLFNTFLLLKLPVFDISYPYTLKITDDAIKCIDHETHRSW